MKSKYFLFAMLFGITISTVACKKCQTCTKANSDDVEVCKSDANGVPGYYKAQIKSWEGSGYECK